MPRSRDGLGRLGRACLYVRCHLASTPGSCLSIRCVASTASPSSLSNSCHGKYSSGSYSNSCHGKYSSGKYRSSCHGKYSSGKYSSSCHGKCRSSCYGKYSSGKYSSSCNARWCAKGMHSVCTQCTHGGTVYGFYCTWLQPPMCILTASSSCGAQSRAGCTYYDYTQQTYTRVLGMACGARSFAKRGRLYLVCLYSV